VTEPLKLKFDDPEQRRAYMRPAISGKAYTAISRRVAEWAARDYTTDAQRQELAELILRWR